MAVQPSPTILAATVAELRGHAPFDQMSESPISRLAANLTLRYYAEGSVIKSPEDGVVNTLSILQRGQVVGVNPSPPLSERPLTLVEGEMFPIGAMISKRATVLTFSAATDVFCYELSESGFAEVMETSPEFRNFATARLAHMLDLSRQHIQSEFSRNVSGAQTMASPLRSLIKRPPVTVNAATPISQVLAMMQQLKIGSMIVVEESSTIPCGIFTERDVLARVALPQVDQSAAIASVMTTDPVALPSTATVFEAAKIMAERRFRHVLVTDEGRLVGLVSERDLFQMQRLSLGEIAKSIDRCADGVSLAKVADDVRQMAEALVGQGVAAEQLTQFVTTMNDAIVGKAIELAAIESPPPSIEWCWIGLGSEGRMEQTLVTDQDNALIFAPAVSASTTEIEALRAAFLAFATVANRLLDQAGFPFCRGNIMAKNPHWCLTQSEWRNLFEAWMRSPSSAALLNAAIFFDFRALHGKSELVTELRDWLRSVAPRQKLFLHQMAANALQVRPPLGLIRDFVDADEAYPGTIDLKKFGIRPFIDAARIFALAQEVSATNTADRLRQAMRKMRVGDDEISAYIDSFHFVQLLRLRSNQRMADTDIAGRSALVASQTEPDNGPNAQMANRIRTDALNDLDRRILKEALRQARKLQARVEMDFHV
jgi:CBS domain-containing protein